MTVVLFSVTGFFAATPMVVGASKIWDFDPDISMGSWEIDTMAEAARSSFPACSASSPRSTS